VDRRREARDYRPQLEIAVWSVAAGVLGLAGNVWQRSSGRVASRAEEASVTLAGVTMADSSRPAAVVWARVCFYAGILWQADGAADSWRILWHRTR